MGTMKNWVVEEVDHFVLFYFSPLTLCVSYCWTADGIGPFGFQSSNRMISCELAWVFRGGWLTYLLRIPTSF